MFDPAMFSLAGRRAVVTGGGRGLGRAVAEALGRMGAEVCLAGRDHAVLDEAVAALRNAGVAARACAGRPRHGRRTGRAGRAGC